MENRKPVMLVILDGWGIRQDQKNNSVLMAQTPFLDNLFEKYAHTQLSCSGESVGLPSGVMGNSEVGHLNIGAGRIVLQDLLRINTAIQNKDFFINSIFKSAFSKIRALKGNLHLMGLLSDGSVHSHIDHLYTLLSMAKLEKIKNVYIHAILDGRDTPPNSGMGYIEQLKAFIKQNSYGKIASICGRFFAMDRDNRWNRTEKAYRLYTLGIGRETRDPIEAVQSRYNENESDEFMSPIIVVDNKEKPVGMVQDNDAIIFFNFRSDRARQITRAFTKLSFTSFNRTVLPKICDYICMTQYDEEFTLPVAFPPFHLDHILGEVISSKGLKQLRIAETEKYAHVTYFFNGGEEKEFPREDRCLIPSPRDVKTYDLKPEMSARLVTEEVIKRLKSNKYDLIILNFANMDMVGHTGDLKATITACETIDTCLSKVIGQALNQKTVVFLTADHGNAETMVDHDGNKHTAHTVNPVPLVLIDDSLRHVNLKPGILADIAPTILEVMKIEKPKAMTGESLIYD